MDRKFKGDKSGLDRVPIKVHDPPRRRHGVYIGASFLAANAPAEKFISKKEFEESGDKIFA